MKSLPSTSLVLGLALLGLSCRTHDTYEILWERDERIVYEVETEQEIIALTIDDGPDPIGTPRILETLASHGARATFFLLTDQVAGNEELVEAILAGGNEIANHGTRDRPAVDLGAAAFEQDLVAADEILSPYGVAPWYRPGSGWYDDWMFEILDRHGYSMVLGTAYPLDAELPFVSLSSRIVLWRADRGGVIILHDVGKRALRTAEVLDRVLPELQRRGLGVVTLSELVASSSAAIEDAAHADPRRGE